MRLGLSCFLLLSCLTLGLAQSSGSQTYDTRYDNVDLDEILSNDRLYKKYYDCITGKGKCTPDGKMLKERLPEALKTHCAKCTPKQRAGAEKVLKFMLKRKESDYTALEKLYDPGQTIRKSIQTKGTLP